ncbi:hypothetical protein [Arsukibacterium indicum]|uniref:HDOD domain-containing protein n=1 Tax=Arsukibacterium indicum TaxID=2848612 RepID=A0ABS6MHH6_9GAMM|nr:hypothetical protein [Arsukibacterium indicum]MBV2128243.1 hypothetical protein [Arsukibacterium indicum]
MATADRQWPQFYLGIQQLKQLRPKPTVAASEAMPALLQRTAELCSLFIELANDNAAGIMAQLNLSPRPLPLYLARIVKMLALALILSRCYSWQRQRTEQLLQTLLNTAVFADDSVTSQQAWVRTAKALQQYDQQHPQLPLLIGACNSQRQPPWQLHPDGPLLALVSQLAEKMLPETGSQPGLSQLLNQYLSHQAGVDKSKWYCLLLQLSQTNALPGRFARNKTSRNLTHYWFIIGQVENIDTAKQAEQTAQVYVRQFDPASKSIGHEVHQMPLAELALLSPQYFKDFNWLGFIERDNTLLPAIADNSLSNCVNQSLFARLTGLSVSKQVQMLEQRPLISQFLQRNAASISRQQLPVNRLRHAITMLGQDALQSWVAQAEVYQYCQQQGHPHQSWLEQLQHCLIQALHLLSSATPRPIALSKAGVIARCASVSIWQEPALFQTALARQVRQQPLLGIYIQQHIWRSASYPELTRQLLEHYQHPDWALAIQGWHSQRPGTLALLLRLSWQLTMAVFIADEVSEQRLTALLPAAAGQLALPKQPVTYWQQQLIAASQCYYPLPEM